MAEAGLVAFFGIWLTLTLFRQFKGTWVTALTGWDKVGLIPVYRFFAPFPGRFDYHFLVRFQDEEAAFSNWLEFGPSNARSRLCVVFHPHKRLRKAYLDLVTELARELEAHGGRTPEVNLSYPYLSLLLAAEQFLRDRFSLAPGVAFQFMILASYGREEREMEPLMLSSVHRMS